MGMPLAREHVPHGGAMWTPAISTLSNKKSSMSHACLCAKSNCMILQRGAWRFLSWSTAMMLYPCCLTASDNFALPAHNSTKKGTAVPFGTCKESIKPAKTSLRSRLVPWGGSDDARSGTVGKSEFTRPCGSCPACSLGEFSHSLLLRVHSTAGCCP